MNPHIVIALEIAANLLSYKVIFQSFGRNPDDSPQMGHFIFVQPGSSDLGVARLVHNQIRMKGLIADRARLVTGIPLKPSFRVDRFPSKVLSTVIASMT